MSTSTTTLFVSVSLAALAAALTGCGATDSPQRLADKAKTLGVYVADSGALQEIANFVEDDSSGTFRREGTSPARIGRFDFFVVNVPSADLAASAVYRFPASPTSGSRDFDPRDSSQPRPLRTRIEPLAAGIYKVSLSEPLSDQKGSIALRLNMPMGTPDRLYEVETASGN